MIPGVVLIDLNAAGFGWFVDATPGDNSEFRQLSQTEFRAKRTGGAYGQMDLLTAIMYEMGHVLGEDHSGTSLMADTLAAGVRKIPVSDLAWAALAADEFYSSDDELDDTLLTTY